MKTALLLSTGLLALTSVLLTPARATLPSPGHPTVACDAAAIKAPADTTIKSARTIDAPAKYCRIDGYVTTQNPGPNNVGFMIAMPDQWNGRYVLMIPGGTGGYIPDPPANYMTAGYAVASTDRGTQPKGIIDFSFETNPAQAMDYGYRGAHVAAVASQALAQSYYGAAQKYRYITGCSAGGRGSLTEAEWYPEDGEAFVAGAVDADTGSVDFTGYMAQSMFRDPRRWISEDEMKRVADVIMKEYDASDGAIDGLIWDPTKIVLRRDLFPFLSDQQYAMLKLLGDGFPNANGKAQGYWLSNPVGLAKTYLGTAPPPWTPQTQPRMFMISDTLARAKNGPNYNVLTDMDYTKPVVQQPVKHEPGSLSPEFLGPVQKLGGKVLFWAGASDQSIAPLHGTDFTDAVTKIYGAKRTNWFRTYLAPGMYHCLGGVGQPTNMPDAMLHAAEEWVEQGKTPDFVIASNPAINRTYKLCSYPHLAVFKGGLKNPDNLDVKDANNWACTGMMRTHQKPAAQ